MSARPIRAGDRVMVVKPLPCCGCAEDVGRVYVAGKHYNGPSRCGNCGYRGPVVGVWVKTRHVRDFNRLKLIDPPATGDSLPTRRELEETA